MFIEIADLMSDSDMLTLVVTKKDGIISVSVLPKKVGLKDEAKNHLSPMVLRGTPEEIDQHFISQVRSPLEKTIGMLTNMAVYEKSMEETIAKSKAATEAKKQEDAKKKAFTEKMKKVETLFNEKKISEAALLLKQASDMPCADKKQCEIMKSKIDVELNSGTLFVD
ncbi:PRTRC system protein E [Bacteroides cellulosilyticus]|uniref:PRTRC system protein E n=1 Tax=Bacteroides cellulosilyticus TaxID=246787 RepID=UPI0022E08825|nr:PRTRC system protein E [Bacteroides cellulosilyticus]